MILKKEMYWGITKIFIFFSRLVYFLVQIIFHKLPWHMLQLNLAWKQPYHFTSWRRGYLWHWPWLWWMHWWIPSRQYDNQFHLHADLRFFGWMRCKDVNAYQHFITISRNRYSFNSFWCRKNVKTQASNFYMTGNCFSCVKIR